MTILAYRSRLLAIPFVIFVEEELLVKFQSYWISHCENASMQNPFRLSLCSRCQVDQDSFSLSLRSSWLVGRDSIGLSFRSRLLIKIWRFRNFCSGMTFMDLEINFLGKLTSRVSFRYIILLQSRSKFGIFSWIFHLWWPQMTFGRFRRC